MAVKIRLRRAGKTNAPSHRVVVADSRSPRDGRFIELVGIYDPRKNFEQIDLERVDYWIGNGAQPSDTVSAMIRRARAGIVRDGTKTRPDAAAKAVAKPAEEKAADVESAEE